MQLDRSTGHSLSVKSQRTRTSIILGLTALSMACAEAYASMLDGAELVGECKVIYVGGEPDHCILVDPGTDRPVRFHWRH
jgi:hypothetical protein